MSIYDPVVMSEVAYILEWCFLLKLFILNAFRRINGGKLSSVAYKVKIRGKFSKNKQALQNILISYYILIYLTPKLGTTGNK